MQPATPPLGRRRFRPRIAWALVAVCAVAGTIALGNWQLDRAREKQALADRVASLGRDPPIHVAQRPLAVEDVEHRRLEASGYFEPRHAILLENRVRRGIVGYEVVMPLRIDGATQRLLVNRGWIAGTGSRAALPALKTPASNVAVVGLAVVPGRRIYELGPAEVEGNVWQNLTIERYRARFAFDVQPVIVLQENDTGDGLVRDWPAFDAGVATHKSYAVQWFALAILIAVTWLLLSFRRDAADA